VIADVVVPAADAVVTVADEDADRGGKAVASD
jgi:hypothetical protein